MADPAEEPEQPNFKSVFFRIALMFMAYQFISSQRGVKAPPSVATPTPPSIEKPKDFMRTSISTPGIDSTGVAKPKPRSVRVTDPSGLPLPPIGNLWRDGQRMELRVYMSDEKEFTDFANKDMLLWREKQLRYDWSESNSREKEMNITTWDHLRNNGTVYAHIFMVQAGFSPNPASPNYDELATIYKRHELTRHKLRKKKVARRNLLSGENSSDIASELDLTDRVVSYWKPTLHLSLVHDFSPFTRDNLPSQMKENFAFHPDMQQYYPNLYVNEFWLTMDHLVQVNETVEEVPLSLSYSTLGLFKWQMQTQMTQSWSTQAEYGTSSEEDTDSVKRLLQDTNPYLLALTMVVSVLHMVFDMLAFKNDINFWRKKKSMVGLSIRSIFINTFFQTVIFLYLLDNDTSWMILLSSGMGLAIEAWKIKKAVHVKVRYSDSGLPRLQFSHRSSYTKSDTKKFDDMAIAHLLYAIVPLGLGYSVYSLMYDTHKSWYSWVLNSVCGFVYAFGFIMMTPQLFINYKLKSVAHMPWRAMVYKSLNTFIDDMFAFIIKMPIMHRLSCFRDDLIFFIYLYQRWAYPVDRTRRNEFGTSGEMIDGVTLVDADGKPLPQRDPDDDYVTDSSEDEAEKEQKVFTSKRGKRSKIGGSGGSESSKLRPAAAVPATTDAATATATAAPEESAAGAATSSGGAAADGVPRKRRGKRSKVE